MQCHLESTFSQLLSVDLFNHEICLLNILPSNEAYTLEAVKMVNFVEIDRITEIIVPGMVEMDHTRIATFLSGVEIYVYDEQLQLNMLKRVFGPEALIGLTDIAPEVWKVFPSLQKKSLLRIRENSRLAR